MDVTRVLTVVDHLVHECRTKTGKVIAIKNNFNARCMAMDDEVYKLIRKAESVISRAWASDYFCELSAKEQREFLKKYYNGNGNGNGKGKGTTHAHT